MTASLVVEVPGEPPFEVLLDRERIVVGRQDTDLALRDMNVSRRHFRIERHGGIGHVLRDEKSRNGTFVNGVSVIDKLLSEGDKIHVGGTFLTFRALASGAAIPLELAPKPLAGPGRSGVHRLAPSGGEPTIPSGTTTRRPGGSMGLSGLAPALPPAQPSTPAQTTTPARPPAPRPSEAAVDALARTPPPLVDALAKTPSPGGPSTPSTPLPAVSPEPGTRSHPRPSRAQVPVPQELVETKAAPPPGERWRKLAEVACAINLEHEIDRLLERILDAVLALVPAKCGYLVLKEGERLVTKAKRNAPETVRLDPSVGGRISQQVCQEALAQRRPVLTQDAVSDERLGQFQTVMSLQIKSILCVPFSSQEEALGVVYLDEPQVDPFAEDGEVVELVGAFGDLAGIALANARHMSEIATRERMEEELRIGARIQKNLLPKAPPQVRGLELAGTNVPAREVGGDLYDFARRTSPEDEVLISIGDVSGKGVGAGIVMSTTRALVRAYAEMHGPTDEILVHVNRALTPDLEAGQFVSFLLMRYAEATGRLSFTGAGHEHLVLYRPSTRQLEFMRAGGVVLGLTPDLRGRIQERSMMLQPGDVVCLYTDGATEAPSPSGEEFGLERIGQAVQAGPLDPASIVQRVVDAVVAHTGAGRELADDLTVVALRKT